MYLLKILQEIKACADVRIGAPKDRMTIIERKAQEGIKVLEKLIEHNPTWEDYEKLKEENKALRILLREKK